MFKNVFPIRDIKEKRCPFDQNAIETTLVHLTKVENCTSPQDHGHMRKSDDKVRSLDESLEDISVSRVRG